MMDRADGVVNMGQPAAPCRLSSKSDAKNKKRATALPRL
jgi:hypothetical protein